MRYMLLVYMNEQAMSDAERQECYVESAQLAQTMHADGKFVAAAPLHMVARAKSVRVCDGKSVVTDGPFAETREQLGGFYIVDVENLDEALCIAAQIPPARKGTIEVRPILEISGVPPDQRQNRKSEGRK